MVACQAQDVPDAEHEGAMSVNASRLPRAVIRMTA
jgi:hypothetical protein